MSRKQKERVMPYGTEYFLYCPVFYYTDSYSLFA